jgi:hypothetical protein
MSGHFFGLVDFIIFDTACVNIFFSYTDISRSQWSCGLTQELSSLARMLGSWVRTPLKAWMSVYAFILCLCCCV